SREPLPISEHHPSLFGRLDLTCQPMDAKALAALGVKCAFGCLPHGTSMEVIPPLLAAGITVIDLSADYRLKDPAVYQSWYKEAHHDTLNLTHAVYGLPELNRDAIRNAQLIANPGCYPQTAILGLAPLVAAGMIDTTSIIIDSKSGVSGAGREPKKTTHFPECNESVSAYGLGQHRHTPEIEQSLSLIAQHPVEVIFTPHLMPMDRGIFSTIYANLRQPKSEADLLELYTEYFQAEPFVRVRKSLPATKDTLHTNYLDICPKVVRGRAVILAAEDNLVRGASGVAVQNFNICFGFPESTALV
ncbi:MAG: N-acetyl-gamma-glutamyl-phosphate reductase, partial [Gemmataceae bacterium]